jgi:hypothetical protein
MTYIMFRVQCGTRHFNSLPAYRQAVTFDGRHYGIQHYWKHHWKRQDAVSGGGYGSSDSNGDNVLSVALTNDPLLVTVTRSTAPSELATPFARPTHTAKPCAARATMPC